MRAAQIASGVLDALVSAHVQGVMHLDATAATRLLWDAYHPWKLWIPFAAIGIASAVGIFFYSRWVAKYEAADI